MPLYAATSRNAAIVSPQNLGATNKCIINITAATTAVRGWAYEFDVGADGTPNATDCAIVWEVHRCTSIGTGNTGTITFPDVADIAGTTVATVNCTIEPTGMTTQTAVWALAANQRASYRWVVNPGGPGELCWPATNTNGLAWEARSATYASTVVVGVLFRT